MPFVGDSSASGRERYLYVDAEGRWWKDGVPLPDPKAEQPSPPAAPDPAARRSPSG